MFKDCWKKEIITIPNLLSLLRLILIPVYIVIYCNAKTSFQFYTAGIIISISCMTDLLDGKIARRFHMESTVGKILDPLADKLTQLTLTFCLSIKYPSMMGVLILLVLKELLQLGLGIHHLIHGKILSGALTAGKICTTVLFLSLILLVIIPDMHPRAVSVIALIDGLFLLISLTSYLLAYLGNGVLLKPFIENE